ncbi:MAG: hypothetical protein ACI837_002669 [Crocinitomicaceae bacterium]|jgi:hypothetical protein
MKTIATIILLATAGQLQAQDTLLISSNIVYDENHNPVISWLTNYDEEGNIIESQYIYQHGSDTSFNIFNYDEAKRLKNTIHYRTRFGNVKDTTFYRYDHDTTIISSKGEYLETIYKLDRNGELFFSSMKTYESQFKTTSLTVDSVFYDPIEKITSIKTYKMNEPVFTNGRPMYALYSGVGSLDNEESGLRKPTPKKIEIGGVLKEIKKFENKRGEITKEITNDYSTGITGRKHFDYDADGRLIKSDQFWGHDTTHWTNYSKYDTINDSLRVKTWGQGYGYHLSITPLNSTQEFASIVYYYDQNDLLLSTNRNEFNKQGLFVSSKEIWHAQESSISGQTFDSVQTTECRYLSFPKNVIEARK